MKKSLFLLIALVFALGICLVACDINGGDTHTHSFGEWVTIKKVTCSDEGEMARYCDCGEKQTETPPPNGEHTEVIDEAVAPTCTKSGLTEGKHCSVCNTVIIAQTSIDPKGHTEVIDEAVAPTCTKSGLTEGKHCSVCDAVLVEQEATELIRHSYDDKYDEICNVCGDTRDAECAHTTTESIPGYAARCTESGLTDGQKCKKCGEIVVSQTSIDPKGHTEVIDEAVAPTCTESGLTEGKHCSVCNTVIIAQTSIDPKGHTEVVDKAVAPTCTKSGLTEGKHCSVCNTILVQQETILALEHVFNTTYSFDNNFHWYACQGCGAAKDKAEHQVGDDDMCTMCDTPMSATEGVIYEKSDDGTYAMVVGYNGTAKKIKFATEYKGLPVQVICHIAFYNNDNITTVVIPDSVTTIGDSAFEDCDRLSSVVIGNSVTTIGDSAFEDCDRLSSVVIGDSVTTIDGYAFYDCDSLSSVVFGNSLTYIGTKAFRDCHSLNSVVFGDSLTYIDHEAFRDCHSLSSVVIPDSVTTICYGAFASCDSLSSVVIGDSVTTIGYAAFYDCDRLSSVVIPDSLTSIGDYAFYYCYSLTDVYYTGSEEEWQSIEIGSDNYNLTYAKIHYNYVPEN